MEIHKLIRKRWSPVIFSEKDVEDEKLELLFKAAGLAPSSYNRQPWRFIITKRTNPENFKLLFDCLSDENKEWAKYVPVFILSIAEVISGYTKKRNKYAFHDTGMAVGNMLIQATDMGLYVHQMGGYDAIKLRQDLKIPEQFEPVAMIALGYQGDSSLFPQHLKERDEKRSGRKPLKDFVFNVKWESKYF